MRLKLIGGAVLGGAVALLTSVTASAASINVQPASVAAGGHVTLSGDVLAPGGQPGCAVPGTVTLISGAFAGQGSFQGQDVEAPVGADGKYSVTARILPGIKPGSYTVTGRCGGGNLGVQATLTVIPAPPVTGTGPAGETGVVQLPREFPGLAVALLGVGVALLIAGLLAYRRNRAGLRAR